MAVGFRLLGWSVGRLVQLFLLKVVVVAANGSYFLGLVTFDDIGIGLFLRPRLVTRISLDLRNSALFIVLRRNEGWLGYCWVFSSLAGLAATLTSDAFPSATAL